MKPVLPDQSKAGLRTTEREVIYMRKQKKGYKKITQKDFELVHLLKDKGLKLSKITEVIGRSYWTIIKLAQANSLEEYTERTRKDTEKYAKAEADKAVTAKDGLLKLATHSPIVFPESNDEKIITALIELTNAINKLVAIDTKILGIANEKIETNNTRFKIPFIQ